MGIMSVSDAEKEVKVCKDQLDAHLAKYRPLIEAVLQIHTRWSKQIDGPGHWGERDKRGRSVSVTYSPMPHSICCVALDLYLGPEDSITKDLALFAEKYCDPIAETLGLGEAQSSSYIDLGWSGLEYQGNGLRLLVRGWFSNSLKCHVVGTGEMQEVKKVVCDA